MSSLQTVARLPSLALRMMQYKGESPSDANLYNHRSLPQHAQSSLKILSWFLNFPKQKKSLTNLMVKYYG